MENAFGLTYRPLDASKREFRLLSTKPDLPAEDDLLEFHLEHASLADGEEPEYFAVSYTWGDEMERRWIIVDGNRVEVPENNEIALRNLHRAVVAAPSPNILRPENHPVDRIKFFVDAVCINQADFAERGQQVAIMWRIYQSASKVLIWLGFDDGTTAAAIEQLNTVVAECREQTDGFARLSESLWSKTNRGYVCRQLDETDLSHLDWTAISSFYSAPWFGRLWVVQETAVAREAFCIRGEHVVPWETVAVAARWLVHKVYHKSLGNGSRIGRLESAGKIEDYRRGDLALFSIFLNTYAFQTSEPRDKVFGFLGLFQAFDKSPQLLERLMPPDYTASTADIYGKLAKALLEISANLFLLSYVQMYRHGRDHISDLDCPSWAPRLHTNPEDENGRFISANPLNLGTSGPGACNALPLSLGDSNANLRFLHLSGCIVDQIVDRTDGRIGESHEEIVDFVVESYRLPGTGVSEEQFARVMTIDSRSNFNQLFSKPAHRWPPMANWYRWSTEDDSAVREYAQYLSDTCYHRCCFVTRKGFIGMGTFDVKRGDTVCIFFGGHVPYTLRSTGDDDDSWTLIGDAYVDGIMDGEYIQQLQDEDRLESETGSFTLR